MPGCSKEVQRRVDRLFARQFSVLSVGQAVRAGMTRGQIRWSHQTGRWIHLFSGAFQKAGTPSSPKGLLLAACLATGGQASHESAAWWWDLLDDPPPEPTITVPTSARSRRQGMVIHRSTGQRFTRPLVGKVPCTDARRTVVDLASVAETQVLDDAIDRGLSRGLFTVPDLFSELKFLDGRRQTGVAAVRRSLVGRHCGAPNPSWLESHTLRLLANAGIHPLLTEQRVDVEGGFYRLDFVLLEGLALEVDGYFNHFNPEAHDSDRWRQNELFVQGDWEVVGYTWRQIIHEPGAVIAQLRRVLAAFQARGRRPNH